MSNTQYVRTDKAIQSALMLLLRKKPFGKITVQDILDETPVSRATFYKHYHDKYEIVEKMQEDFLLMQKDVINAFASATPTQIPALVDGFSSRYRETMQLLLKVQTDRVNLPQFLMRESEAHYMEDSNSPTKEIEAHVYAAALTAYQIAYLEATFPITDTPRVFLAVALKLLGLSDDPETVKFLTQKLE